MYFKRIQSKKTLEIIKYQVDNNIVDAVEYWQKFDRCLKYCGNYNSSLTTTDLKTGNFIHTSNFNI